MFLSFFCSCVGFVVKFWPMREKLMHCILAGVHAHWLEFSSYLGP